MKSPNEGDPDVSPGPGSAIPMYTRGSQNASRHFANV